MPKEKNKFLSKIKLINSPKRDVICALIFSFLFSYALFLGMFLSEKVSPAGTDYLLAVLYSIIPTILVGEAYLWLKAGINKDLSKRETAFDRKKDWKYYLTYLGCVFGCWFIYFLAFYPGIFAYDIRYQMVQTTGSYSTHHPLAHTLLLKAFQYVGNKVGNVTFMMSLYTILQILILAAAVAYLLLFLKRTEINKVVRIVLMGFAGVCPLWAMLAISATKDILFAAFFLFAFVALCYFSMCPETRKQKRFWFLYVGALTLSILFRNNALYGFIILLIVGVIVINRKNKLLFGILTLIGILIPVLLNAGLAKVTDASKGSLNEALSVPYQQMAFVYTTRYDDLTEDEKEAIEKLIPSVENINYYRTDDIKGNGTILENKKEFISTYLGLLVKYPKEYIEAFLQLTKGYWDIGDTSSGEIYGYHPEWRVGYLLADTHDEANVTHTSLIPWLEEISLRLCVYNDYQRIPVVSIIFSMGFYFWLMILCLFYAINQKSKKAALALICVLAYTLTIFAGPCAIVRYAFPYIICVPGLFVVALKKSKEELQIAGERENG